MSVCYSTATDTQYTTIAAGVVSTALRDVITTLPASATTVTSSICSSQAPTGTDTDGTVSCSTVTSVSTFDPETITIQFPVAVTLPTTVVWPLSTLYATTCSSQTTSTTATQQTTTTQTTPTTVSVSTSVPTVASSTLTSATTTSTVTTAIESSSSVAISPAAASAASSSSNNTGLIVGAAVGGAVALILVILVIWLLCCRRRRQRKRVRHLHCEKSPALTNDDHFNGSAMVQPTPYPFRDHSASRDSSSNRPQMTRSETTRAAKRKPVPALDTRAGPQHPIRVSRERDVVYALQPAPLPPCRQANPSAPARSLSVPAERPSRSLGAIPTRSLSPSGVAVPPPAAEEERPHAWKAASSPPPRPPRGAGPRPRTEKTQIHLHPDRGLTAPVVPREVKVRAPRSGPPAPMRDAAWRGQAGVSGPERKARGGGEPGGSDAAPSLREAGGGQDACETGTAREMAAGGLGVTWEKRRRQGEHRGEKCEAPPAYCE